MTIDSELERAYDRLRAVLEEMGSVVIGMSGGVDSVLLAKVAHDVLGERALAVTADSPSLPRRELREAEELARLAGIRHLVVPTAEVADPRYAANPTNRCYFCKSTLFARLDTLAAERGIAWVAYGENQDDMGDHRPGAVAAGEHNVRAPLKEAGLGKAAIRALARSLGLPVWDKPAFACLGSRFPYGMTITPEKLAQVEAAEEVLWQLGFRQYRVRYHDDLARIEVAAEDMPQLIAHAAEVASRLRAEAGFRHVTLDLAGYRRGSMNEGRVEAISLVER
ncbi:ATP-dependent sacrificial sulfur transferase LarE [Oscillochloris sp. ZM17-4]|uniref:ATP-dependent sacrificial sulfur transferase LarE n=1 Tax=Oscillochloris sp. ZM17-4 TaxID=2866714 RepID=UPI001C72CDE2|nr:ATP-dependent sacrificial sulfur transferase LarE [Oscillochloris sp. ZM17-4]MBX0328029.1 ATP-dependent sacrificial sulfur transferase LarE [Oscillochloris sp. ZM17-4]